MWRGTPDIPSPFYAVISPPPGLKRSRGGEFRVTGLPPPHGNRRISESLPLNLDRNPAIRDRCIPGFRVRFRFPGSDRTWTHEPNAWTHPRGSGSLVHQGSLFPFSTLTSTDNDCQALISLVFFFSFSAIRALLNYPTRIKSYAEARTIKGVGEKTASKVRSQFHLPSHRLLSGCRNCLMRGVQPPDYPSDKICTRVITIADNVCHPSPFGDAGCGLDYGNHQHRKPETDRT